jgi:aminoglycoside phosphotransferase (APT) family kinase protein
MCGALRSAVPYGNGHINQTYLLEREHAGAPVRYILQRINGRVFQDPVRLVQNVANVTRHIRARLEASGTADLARRVMTLVPALDGAPFHRDAQDQVWRCCEFVEGARSCDAMETPEQAYQAARAFGSFQALLADYQGPPLFETIPDFHHTRSRFEALRRAIAADPRNRAARAAREIRAALEREALADSLLALKERGILPERITHNDTKLNNVLLDERTGEGLCVLDLDTVMPGLSLYDFGDMVRTATNPVAEDAPGVERVQVQVPLFQALARGYLEGTGGLLLPAERERLVLAGQLITFEQAIRFLTDFLQGDTYYPVRRPEHNLDRARTQFALLASLEAHEDQLYAFVRSLEPI